MYQRSTECIRAYEEKNTCLLGTMPMAGYPVQSDGVKANKSTDNASSCTESALNSSANPESQKATAGSAIADASAYEKSFLERHLRTVAARKLEALDARLKEVKSAVQRAKLENEKKRVQADLDADLHAFVYDTDANAAAQATFEHPSTNPSVHTCPPAPATKNMQEVHESDVCVRGYCVPSGLWRVLLPHQRIGAEWLISLYATRKGGILADEMGLGKTIQAAALIAAVTAKDKMARVLVLCPATLIAHWKDELSFKKFNFSPNSKNSRDADDSAADSVRRWPLIPPLNNVDVMSYEGYKRVYDSKTVAPTYSLAILDEGHKIKNKDAQITALVKRLTAPVRVILTGTPIQNNLAELWSLIDFVAPGLLGSFLTFHDEYITRIRSNPNGETAYRYAMMLRATIEPHILRRTKKTIAHTLPAQTDRVVLLRLSAAQDRLYRQAVGSQRLQAATESRAGLLSAIDHLRKICNHPLLLAGTAALSDAALAAVSDDVLLASTKLRAARALLRRWQAERLPRPHRALVFTQTRQMQRILSAALHRAGLPHTSLSGQTPLAARAAIVTRFNTSPAFHVLLLTTRVGGLGLNLTGADRVILFDPDWNPATDAQAKERAHRYGQRACVEVYRLICQHTLEEKIYQRQVYKACLSKKILTDPRARFSADEALDLLDYRPRPLPESQSGLEREGDEDDDLLMGAQAIENGDAKENVESDSPSNDECDRLPEVRSEDEKEFEILKEMATQRVLSGKELLEFIERRELSLKDSI